MALLDVLAAAAAGQFPDHDGRVEVHPDLPGKAAADARCQVAGFDWISRPARAAAGAMNASQATSAARSGDLCPVPGKEPR